MLSIRLAMMTTLALAGGMACSAGATTVAGNNTGLVDLGSFAAGTYLLTGSGLVDLVGSNTFTLRPDGVPDHPVTASGYGYFNPSGSFIADGSFARAGSNAKVGALVGTLNSAAYLGNNPSGAQQADWFLIGYSAQVTLVSPGHVYAAINDTFGPNNSGAFTVSATAVPEPASWAMAGVGLALLGALARRRAAGGHSHRQ
jgi:hypothetical protein